MPPPGGWTEEARRLATTSTLEEVKGVLTELIQGLRETLPSFLAATPPDSGPGAWRTIGGRPFGPPQEGPREGEPPWTLERPYGHLFGGGSESKGR